MTLRVCKKCNDEKDLNLFLKKKNSKGVYYYHYTCLDCNRKYNQKYFDKYYQNNKDELVDNSKKWYQENSDKKKEYDQLYMSEHKKEKKEYDRQYRNTNKRKISKRVGAWRKAKRINDPTYRLRKSISYSIWYYLTLSGSSKNNKSCLKFLPYSMQELKEHLEKQFEPWMNWNNYGLYHVNQWSDNDMNTWTWQIDHIIPQSKLLYLSMEDENFKKCWALNNLRPLASKENLMKSDKYENL